MPRGSKQRLLSRLGWPPLHADVEDAILARAQEVLEEEVGRRIARELLPNELEEIAKILERENDAAGRRFLRNRVPTYTQIADEERARLDSWLTVIGRIVRDVLYDTDEAASARFGMAEQMVEQRLPDKLGIEAS